MSRQQGARSRGSRVAAARLVALVAAGGMLAWMLASVDVPTVGRLLLSIGPAGLLVPVPYLVAMSLDTLAWRRMLRREAGAPPFSRLLLCRLAAEATAALVPSAGLAAEATAATLLRRWGVAWDRIVATLAVRRGVALFAHGLVVGLATLLQRLLPSAAQAPIAVTRFRSFPLTAAMATSSAVLMAAALLLYLLPRAASRQPWAVQFRRSASPRVLGAAVPLWVLVWLVEAFETFLILMLLGTGLDFPRALVCESAASLVRAVAVFVPSGIGVQDGAYLALLQAVGVPDAAAAATAFVLLKRTKEALWVLVGLLILSRAGRPGNEPTHTDPVQLRIAKPGQADAPGRPRAAGA